MSALDQAVTLTPDQITYLDTLARRRISQLSKSIETAQFNRLAGMQIQHGTLDRHYTERDALLDAREAFEHARKQIQEHFRDKLGIAEKGG